MTPTKSGLRVTNLDARAEHLPAWEALPKVGTADGIVYLVNVVSVDHDVIDPIGLHRFLDRLDTVLQSGQISGRLGPIVSIPLAKTLGPDRCMVASYLQSASTKDELNALLGGAWFVDEGSLGEFLS